MIPEEVQAHLKRDFLIKYLGTRDKHLQTAVTWVWSVLTNAEKREMTITISASMFDRIRPNLEDNGQMAVTISHPTSHETYQFKGSYQSSGEPSAALEKRMVAHRDNIAAFNEQMGMPEEVIQNIKNIRFGRIAALTFKISAIYLQTPGPQAGKRVI